MAAPASPVGRIAAFRHFVHALGANPLLMWSEESFEAPSVRRNFPMGSMTLLNAPEAVRHVLVANPGNYRRTPTAIRLLRPLAGRGLLLAEGEAWRRQRRVIGPTLAPRALPLLLRHAGASVADWTAGLAAQAEAGPVDLLAAVQTLALDIAGRAMFSVDLAPFAGDMRRLLGEEGPRVSRAGLFDVILPTSMPSPRDFRRMVFRRRWMGLIDRVIASRAAAAPGADARDLYDLLRAATAADGEAGSHLLRDEVATLIIAGHETTALTLFWSALLLADAPETQERIAEEARRFDLGPGGATEAVERLDFTRAVVSEALRLYPAAPTIARQAIRPDRAGDIAIPQGGLVMIAPWVLHRHRGLWSEPERFDPARFLPGAPAIGRYAYLPFGAGPRVCVGAAFAMAEATLALAALLRDWRIAREDDRPVTPVAFITTHPDRAPPFRLTRRG